VEGRIGDAPRDRPIRTILAIEGTSSQPTINNNAPHRGTALRLSNPVISVAHRLGKMNDLSIRLIEAARSNGAARDATDHHWHFIKYRLPARSARRTRQDSYPL